MLPRPRRPRSATSRFLDSIRKFFTSEENFRAFEKRHRKKVRKMKAYGYIYNYSIDSFRNHMQFVMRLCDLNKVNIAIKETEIANKIHEGKMLSRRGRYA